jgi:hypothetical protein
MDPFDPNWYILGFDPGGDGAIVRLEVDFHEPTKLVSVRTFLSRKCHSEGLRDCLEGAVLQVGSQRLILGVEVPGMVPGNGKQAYAKLAASVSYVLGLADAYRLPYVDKIGPVRWQNAMGCRTHGDKKIPYHKMKAEYPELDRVVQKAGADAFWIAMYSWKCGPFSSLILKTDDEQERSSTKQTHTYRKLSKSLSRKRKKNASERHLHD